MMRPAMFATVAGALVSACSTVSFAPPTVPIVYSSAQGGQTCQRRAKPTTTIVNRDVKGAWTVVDTFLAAYSCSRDAAANGRQAFDIPAFLSTTGAATATALGGAPVTIGILGATGSSVFNAGKAYYDPGAKAKIYNQAISALLCIRNQSVGMPATRIQNEKAKSFLNNLPQIRAASSAITVSAEEQYFMMVTTGVYHVRDILADRLSGVGTLSASAVSTEILKAAEDLRKAQEELAKKKKELEDNPGGTETEKALFSVASASGVTTQADLQRSQLGIALAREQELIRLELDALRPKIDECVTTAKL